MEFNFSDESTMPSEEDMNLTEEKIKFISENAVEKMNFCIDAVSVAIMSRSEDTLASALTALFLLGFNSGEAFAKENAG